MFRTRIAMIAVVALAAPAMALDYWPDDPDGLVYRYRHPGTGAEREVVFEVDGEYHVVDASYGDCYYGTSFLPGADTLSLVSWGVFCDGYVDPDYDIYDPPVEIVRPGMADGDEYFWECDSVWYSSIFVYVRVSAETVTVPLGTFDVMKVFYMPIPGNWPWPNELWLDAELGPVRLHGWELVSIEGVVVTEAQTWSEVKSLFR